MGPGDHDRRRHAAPTLPSVDPARAGDAAATLDTRTTQLDPTELARLVGKTMPEQTRAALVVHTPTEQSAPLERPPVREDDRSTGEMIPADLDDLRDQAQREHLDMRTTELDPSVLRAMMVAAPMPPRSTSHVPATRWGSAWNVSELAERALTDAIEPLRKSWASEWSSADFELRARTDMMEPLARPDEESHAFDTTDAPEPADLAAPAAADAARPTSEEIRLAVAARARRRHAAQPPVTRPPVNVPTVTATPPIAAPRDHARSIKTEVVRPLTAEDWVPPAFAWQRTLVLVAAVIVIVVVVGFALTR